jgi:hypothetical protein
VSTTAHARREWEEGIKKKGVGAYCNWKTNVVKSSLDLRRRA